MTQDQAQKRIAAIEKLQNDLDKKMASVDVNLYAQLAANADAILADPRTLTKQLARFAKSDYLPALQQFGVDILTIGDLNATYFEDAIGEELGGKLVSQSLFNDVKASVETLTAEQFGVAASGEVVPGGLFDLFSKDTTVQRQIQQFAYGQKASGIGLNQFKKSLKDFIVGNLDSDNAPNRGVYSRHYDTVAFDAYQQADRVAQQTFADGLQMSAFLYLGGTVPGSRLWCRVRDGKCFLRSEIDKFGTSQDTYGGYENKAIGYFAGKPKGDYSPFVNAGGWRCRHHYSAISDREALRRRPDLIKDKEGRLRVDETSTDRMEPSVPTPGGRKPQKPANTFPDGFTPAATTKEAEQFALDNKLANKVSYDGLHLEVANQVNADLLRLKAQYKSLRPSSIEVMPFQGNYPMQTSVSTSGLYKLQINSKTLGNRADLSATLATFEQQERDLIWLDGSLSGVVTHEIGHMAHYDYLSTNQNSLGNFETVLKKLRLTQPKIDTGSRYGQTRITEAVAELFSKVARDGASALSDAQRKFMNKQLGWKLK